MRLTKAQAIEKLKAGEELYIYTRTIGHTCTRLVARIGLDVVFLKTAQQLEKGGMIKNIGGDYFVWSGNSNIQRQ